MQKISLNNIKRFTAILALLVATNVSYSQEMKFGKPTKLPRTINTYAEESLPLLSADGKLLYFVRTLYKGNFGGQFKGQDIWYSKKLKNGNWSSAKPSQKFNTTGNNAVVGINEEGNRIYLLNSYEYEDGRVSGLSFTEKKDKTWTNPVLVEIDEIHNLKEGNDAYGLFVNKTEDVLIVSMQGKESLGQEDLYISYKIKNKDGKEAWKSPLIHLGEAVNSKGYEISPFLSDDGKTLFFASNRTGGLGEADIYYSKRLDDSWENWSEPVNMGQGINSSKFDAYFTLGQNGEAFFASNRSGRLAELYTVNQAIEKDERPNEPMVTMNSGKGAENNSIPISESTSGNTTIATVPLVAVEKDGKSGENIISTEVPEGNKDQNIVVGEKIKLLENGPLEEPKKAKVLALSAIVDILFGSGSDDILLKYKEMLDDVVLTMEVHKNVKIQLVGHTDFIGSESDNDELSKRRSNSVKQYLLDNGITEDRIMIIGYGENKPIADNNSKKGRERNRRVELKFLK
ncbi:OmpA family protein [Flexithrix dorotheae]|uniref:OmpA family protein n=1 Tax=Flexithrix dorotheae TaxID=70993 RepID=UPI0003600C9E|nr:OmpA family protein [Flexithrix dorotheae]